MLLKAARPRPTLNSKLKKLSVSPDSIQAAAIMTSVPEETPHSDPQDPPEGKESGAVPPLDPIPILPVAPAPDEASREHEEVASALAPNLSPSADGMVELSMSPTAAAAPFLAG